jgi:hypothetical protein
MAAKCSNPSCFTSFRRLTGGRLFRLESDPPLRSSKCNRVEYFDAVVLTSADREKGLLLRSVSSALPEPSEVIQERG